MNAITELAFRGAKRVRVFGSHDKPLFLAADIGDVLEITNIRMAVSRLPEWCRGCDVTVSDGTSETQGRARKTQKMSTVTEAGVYRLVFSSQKPQAEEFTRWVTEEVLPAIRLHGRYEIEQQAKKLAFAHFLTELPDAYRRTFPDDWFEAILGVWGLDYVKARTPGFVGKVINEFVYDSLMDGLPSELKARRTACGQDDAKLHQFLLTEAKDRLKEHLIATKTIALNCQGRPNDFKESFDRVFRGKNQLLLALNAGKKARASIVRVA